MSLDFDPNHPGQLVGTDTAGNVVLWEVAEENCTPFQPFRCRLLLLYSVSGRCIRQGDRKGVRRYSIWRILLVLRSISIRCCLREDSKHIRG